MQLKFDWLIVLENLRRGVLVTDTNLESPKGPRIIYVNRAWMEMTGYDREDIRNKTPRMLQGPKTDRSVVGNLKETLLKRKVFHGQTWNYRKNKRPFLMNWYCYAVYGELGKPIYYVAEQEDLTEIESFRMKQRLLQDPLDPTALDFFAVLKAYEKSRAKKA